MPRSWVTREEAVTLYVKGQVLWTLGGDPELMRGGLNMSGRQSIVAMDSIIACDGPMYGGVSPSLSNALLFRRDGHQCMYCGQLFSRVDLTRDHIVPRVQGGQDIWINVVAACRRCNGAKGGRTPEQAGMSLLAIPFEPNVFEFMYLANRHIRGDQMAYLQAHFSTKRCWDAAA